MNKDALYTSIVLTFSLFIAGLIFMNSMIFENQQILKLQPEIQSIAESTNLYRADHNLLPAVQIVSATRNQSRLDFQ